jgi:hypothetical protein
MGYVIPFFRSDARFVSPHNNFLRVGQGNRLEKQIEHLVAHHDGPVYLLNYAIHAGVHDPPVLAFLHLARDPSSCRTVLSRLDANAIQLCRLSRTN